MSKILYNLAVDSSNKYIKISDAEKGKRYFCPLCKKPFLFRKGHKKRPHFAHKILTTNCTPEGALHYFYKHFLYQKIVNCLKFNQSFFFSWKCQHCDQNHTGNMLKKVSKAYLETYVGQYKPDISLSDIYGKTIVVIEVIVTHKPEIEALQFYQESGISVLTIQLQSEEDLDTINNNSSIVFSFDKCRNPRCRKHNFHKHNRFIYLLQIKCYFCNKPLKLAINYNYVFGYCFNDDFLESDKFLLKNYGIVLKRYYDKVLRYSYLVNTCACGWRYYVNDLKNIQIELSMTICGCLIYFKSA